jgi:phosphate/sulfate permease
VTGSGLRSGGGVNRKVVGEMVTAWLVTVPATVGISWVMYRLTQLPAAAAWAAVGSVLVVLGGGIAYAMMHTIGAEDVEAEIPPELELAKPLTGEPPPDGEDREAA